MTIGPDQTLSHINTKREQNDISNSHLLTDRAQYNNNNLTA